MTELDLALQEFKQALEFHTSAADELANSISESIRTTENYLRDLDVRITFRYRLSEDHALLWGVDPESNKFRFNFVNETPGQEEIRPFIIAKLTYRVKYKDSVIKFVKAFQDHLDKIGPIEL
jgi:hypothetical protein